MAVFDAGSPAYQGTTVTSSATQVFSVTNLTSPWGVTVLNQGPSNVWVGAGTVTTSSGVLLISGAAKRSLIERVASEPAYAPPVAALLRQDRVPVRVLWTP